MKRRALLGVWALIPLAPIAAGASWLGLGDRGRAPSASGLAPALRVGVLGGPEQEILERLASQHAELRLQVVPFGSAEEVKLALREGRIQAASFETAFDVGDAADGASSERALAAVTVTLPLAFYSRRIKGLSELGPGASVALSTDPRRQGRALLVLYHHGLIGFDEALGPRARLADVTSNPRGLKLEAVPESALAAELERASLVALDYAAATRLGLEPARHARAMEDGYSSFPQVLSVQREQLSPRPAWLSRLIDTYHDRENASFILQHYNDSVRRAW